MSTSAGGRRAPAGRRFRLDATVVLGVALPLLTIGALAVVDSPSAVRLPTPPEQQQLDRADLGCPTSGEQGAVLVAPAVDAGEGTVEVRWLAADEETEPEPLDVEPGAVSRVEDQPDPVLVTARDGLAPGLLASRTGGRVLAITRCPAPQPETWFTGLGAGAGHASVLELVNPDAGAAVVDVDVHATRGLLDVPDLRGIRVPGRSALQVDLSVTVPRRRDLAVRVSVSRGRAAVTVRDQIGDPGEAEPAADWVPGQKAPATSSLLLGLPAGPGSRTLSLLNPGSDEARVTVQVVSPESVFTPEGVEEIRLAPGANVSVRLGEVLAEETKRDASGLLVTGSAPVVASLSSLVDDDLAVTGVVEPFDAQATALVPRGEARLVLAGASATGVAVVVSRSESGEELGREEVELAPERSQGVDLPSRTASVEVQVQRTTVAGAVLVTGPGATVVPLVAPALVGYVPAVRPGLPQF